jgi:hypothetical protein
MLQLEEELINLDAFIAEQKLMQHKLAGSQLAENKTVRANESDLT